MTWLDVRASDAMCALMLTPLARCGKAACTTSASRAVGIGWRRLIGAWVAAGWCGGGGGGLWCPPCAYGCGWCWLGLTGVGGGGPAASAGVKEKVVVEVLVVAVWLCSCADTCSSCVVLVCGTG